MEELKSELKSIRSNVKLIPIYFIIVGLILGLKINANNDNINSLRLDMNAQFESIDTNFDSINTRFEMLNKKLSSVVGIPTTDNLTDKIFKCQLLIKH